MQIKISNGEVNTKEAYVLEYKKKKELWVKQLLSCSLCVILLALNLIVGIPFSKQEPVIYASVIHSGICIVGVSLYGGYKLITSYKELKNMGVKKVKGV